MEDIRHQQGYAQAAVKPTLIEAQVNAACRPADLIASALPFGVESP